MHSQAGDDNNDRFRDWQELQLIAAGEKRCIALPPTPGDHKYYSLLGGNNWNVIRACL
jgi:hypothetical protein